ncbi:MAG: phosphoglucomutase/phosphomannomutase family protein [Rhodothermales bacterium]
MAQPITFGTDGWRAVIARDFTFDNLERVARATAQWLRQTGKSDLSVVIGHDTRFMGRDFAEHAARVLVASGVRVLFADAVATTPAVSWATQEYDANAGIVITASHNPPAYNGFKIKADFGGPATPAMIAAVEAEIEPLPVDARPLPTFEALCAAGRIELRDVNRAYVAVLRDRLDIDAIVGSGIRVAHDAMYGAGQGVVTALLGRENVVELRSERNPGFHGQAPEPIERNLGGLSEAVVREGCAVGLANDGDADRIGMVDERGVFVTSHEILALLVKYLHRERGLTGEIIKTFSTTHLLDRMGKAYGLPVETMPVGFKYIAQKMVERDVLVGGEESGGIAVKGHIPERDGIYIGLLVVEMMVKRGKTLSELVQELFDEFGPHHTYRSDLHTTEDKKRRALRLLEEGGGLSEIAGHRVERFDTLDGYKHLMADGWLLVRPSGTEPVLRVYAEADTPEAARAWVEEAVRQLGV